MKNTIAALALALAILFPATAIAATLVARDQAGNTVTITDAPCTSAAAMAELPRLNALLAGAQMPRRGRPTCRQPRSRIKASSTARAGHGSAAKLLSWTTAPSRTASLVCRYGISSAQLTCSKSCRIMQSSRTDCDKSVVPGTHACSSHSPGEKGQT